MEEAAGDTGESQLGPQGQPGEAPATPLFPFNDSRLASETAAMEQHTRLAKHNRAQHMDLFGFSELCDAQSSINNSAGTSPLDPIPLKLTVSRSETWR